MLPTDLTLSQEELDTWESLTPAEQAVIIEIALEELFQRQREARIRFRSREALSQEEVAESFSLSVREVRELEGRALRKLERRAGELVQQGRLDPLFTT